MVIKEESASLKLFNASRITAIELEIKPTVALKPTKNRLATMPIKLVRAITFSRGEAWFSAEFSFILHL